MLMITITNLTKFLIRPIDTAAENLPSTSIPR